MIPLSRRHKFILLPAVLVTALILYGIAINHYQIKNALSYATRPLWDTEAGPKAVVAHYYAEGLAMDDRVCRLHGWKERDTRTVRVLDAVLMSSELDLLEVRMEELDAVVDYFFIVESNATFTGLPKPTYFSDNRDRFSRFEKKIKYHFLSGEDFKLGKNAWDFEARHRNTMTSVLQEHIDTFPSGTETLVIMSDIDELPSKHSIELLKRCDFGPSIHLQLRNYLYSFEWYIGLSSWRASAQIWNKDKSFYRHSQSTNIILADAGWHCSYCFRTISEYVMKMKGFSHSDRIGGNMALLDPRRIQKTICSGKDIFGMLPEAYSYVDLLSQMSLQPLTTAVGIPRYIIEHSERFRFLLPGGCMRS